MQPLDKYAVVRQFGGIRLSPLAQFRRKNDVARIVPSRVRHHQVDTLGEQIDRFSIKIVDRHVLDAAIALDHDSISAIERRSRADDFVCRAGSTILEYLIDARDMLMFEATDKIATYVGRIHHLFLVEMACQQDAVSVAPARERATGKLIIELLRGLNEERGVTIISATHDHKMLAVSDRIIWVSDGKVAKINKRDELKIEAGSVEGPGWGEGQARL